MKTHLKLPILLIVVAALLLAGCGQSKEKSVNNATEFTYWTVNSVYEQYHLDMAQKWNTAHPDRQISLKTRVLEGNQINDKLWTTLHSGMLVSGYDVPDLIDIEYQDFADYVAQNNCLLYPLFESEQVKANKQFEAYIYRDLCFGIPYGMDKMVLYYNEELLAEAGIRMDDILTWDDFVAAGRQYYQNTGKAFTSIDAGHYDFYITLLSQQGMDYNNTSLGLKSEKSILMLEFMERLVTEHVAVLMPGGRADSSLFYSAFGEGEIAVLLDQLSRAAVLADRLPELSGKIGISYIPQMSGGEPTQVWIPGYATAITMTCDAEALLKEFLEFARLNEAAWQIMLSETGGGFYLTDAQIDAALQSADFSPYFCTDIAPLYHDAAKQNQYLPNVTNISKWIESYEYELAKGIFPD